MKRFGILLSSVVIFGIIFTMPGCGKGHKSSRSGIPTSGSTGNGSGTNTNTTTNTNTNTGNYPDIPSPDVGNKFEGGTVPGNKSIGLAEDPEAQSIMGGTDLERECLAAVNRERKKVGLNALYWDNDLADMGRSHALDMAQIGYLSHGSSTNNSYLADKRAEFLGIAGNYKRYSGSGYCGMPLAQIICENASMGYKTVSSVVGGWMGSTGHRNNMLASDHTHGGVGYADGSGGRFWALELSQRK
ncbi:MAG: CAP domain-containing protein [Planctomycetota bacterium]|nr:MAG: CAP domain-containing protein [Planctomycetota bacterium]